MKKTMVIVYIVLGICIFFAGAILVAAIANPVLFGIPTLAPLYTKAILPTLPLTIIPSQTDTSFPTNTIFLTDKFTTTYTIIPTYTETLTPTDTETLNPTYTFTLKPTVTHSIPTYFSTLIPLQPTARYCCKYCTKGKPCGDTCISVKYTCHVGPGCAC